MRGSPTRTLVIASRALSLVAVGLPHPAVAREASPADIFGVDVGTPAALATSLVTASLSCREFGQPRSAIACQGGLGDSARLGLHSTTYWIADGRVTRIFAVSRLEGRSFAECMDTYRERAAHVASLLGQAASEADSEPSWMQTMDDGMKLFRLTGGRVAFRTIWRLPERDLTVRLHADRGVPVLVLGLEARTFPRCAPDRLAAMLMDLFPPAPAATRAAAARGLGECRVGSAAGALAAVVREGSDKQVKVEAVRALGAIGPRGVPHLQAIAKETAHGEVSAMAKALLPKPAAEVPASSERPAVPTVVTPPDAAIAVAPPPPAPADVVAPTTRTPVPAPGARAAATREAPPPAPPAASVTVLPWTATAPGSAVPSPPASDVAAAPPAEAAKPPAPEPPPAPKQPPDGTVLALTTSLVAGGVWGGGLSLLAQQDSPSVLFLIGSAGAVIGGGTAWGLTHFGLRPSPSQALWFANSTAWGTLAGLSSWAASGSENAKLKWGLLVGGESLGMAMGVFGARQWSWTPSQILFANSLVLGAGLAGGGGRLLVRPGEEFRITPLVGYGAAPAMIASAIFSRYLQVSGDDLHLLAASATAGAWSGGLLAYGLDDDPATRDYRLAGGTLLGMGAGYLGAAALAPFVEIAPRRLWLSGVGMLAGNLIGSGSHMMVVPDDGTRRPLWAGLGGLGLGAAAFAAYPHLRLGHQAAAMSLVGAGYGAATWGLAMAASEDGSTTRTQGGVLALGTAGALAGLLASGAFEPGLASYPVTLGSAALGATAGIGVAKLATDTTGTGELVGTLTGSALGLAAGATSSHYARLRVPDFGAAALGGAYGMLVGVLAPSLGDAEWAREEGWPRKNQGGLLLGLPAGVFAGATWSHLARADGTDVAVASVGSALGLGMGLGTGLLWPENWSQPARVGAVAGLSAGLGGALLLERPLRLREGLGESWLGLGAVGAGVGIAEGMLLVGLVDPSGRMPATPDRRVTGGTLLGGSAGLASGLLLSKYFSPGGRDLAVTSGGAVLGSLLGRGLAMTAISSEGRGDPAGTMAGMAAGTAALALVEHHAPLTNTDFAAAGAGLAFGGLTGALAPTLADAEWGGWRRSTQGGLLLGLGGGALAGAALGHVTAATPATVVVGSGGGLLGLGMGAGSGLLWPERYSQPTRIGAVAGLAGGAAAALLLEHPLRLHEGLDEAAVGTTPTTVALGITEGVLLASLVTPSGQVSAASKRQLAGGALLGGSAGLAAGLALSKYFRPTAGDAALTLGGGALGGFLGRGLVMTVTANEGRPDAAGTMAGVLAGASGLALAQRYSPFETVDLHAAVAGMAYGALVGPLAPTLADAEWGGWRRTTQGGLLLGVGAGGIAAATLSHAAGASRESVLVAAAGGGMGMAMGLGTGLLWPEDYSQPARIGAVAGVSAGMLGALLVEHPLRLHEGLGPSAAGLAATGAGLGIAEGILLAALVDPSGEVTSTSARQLAGGALVGGSAGVASGLLLSKYFQPGPAELSVTVGGAVLGGLFGRGLVMTASGSDGRRDTAGTMAGALAGAASLALVEHFSPLGEDDALAGAAGLAYGGFVGALAPTLADSSWGGWRRSTQGGLLLGAGGGAIAAAGLAHATGARTRTVGFGLAGALDGALTGAGVGVLVDQNPDSSQGARIGVVAGATSGLLLGLGFWPRLDWSTENLAFVSAVSAVGGWTGGWAQVLGHASLDDVEQKKVAGGVLAGTGGVSMVATALLPALHVDTDLTANALAMDAIFSGAGAGVGALASRRADAPVWGMLGAGSTGLLLGGALHASIDFERATGLLAFGAIEGLWAGAWLPYVLRPSAEVTDLDHVAGVAAGGLGGVGLSLLASTVGSPRAATLGMAGAGSAIGASLAGGSVLLAEGLHDQRGVGIMLGGTAAGLGVGGLVSRWAPLDGRRGLYLLGGASFGLAEGLAFGWAGRATAGSEYAGSALIGAGLGASLGLASSADTGSLDSQQVLVASGFSAWGGWVGSFTGALANRDPHEVVLGGLAAANLGFAAGYGALRYDWVEPRDFGWLSLAGAMGTALGGGVGAIFSSQSDPRPVLAGLAAGPVVGIAAGLFIVPRLRRPAETSSVFFRAPKVAGIRFDLSSDREDQQRDSTDVLAERKPSRILAGLKLAQRHLFDVTNWTPVFGSLPPLPGDPNPAPFFMGISGGLR